MLAVPEAGGTGDWNSGQLRPDGAISCCKSVQVPVTEGAAEPGAPFRGATEDEEVGEGLVPKTASRQTPRAL